MCHPSLIAFWPPLWWSLWSAGAVTALAKKWSAPTGLTLSNSAPPRLLRLHVSTLRLRSDAPLPSQRNVIEFRQKPVR